MPRMGERMRWAARVLGLFVPMALAWSGLGLTEELWQAARPVAETVLTTVFEDRVREVVAHTDPTWKVRTYLAIMGSGGASTAVFFLGKVPILEGSAGFPLLWALLIATHRRWWALLAWGSGLHPATMALPLSQPTTCKSTGTPPRGTLRVVRSGLQGSWTFRALPSRATSRQF